MRKYQGDVRGFTTQAPRIASVLQNEIFVTEAYVSPTGTLPAPPSKSYIGIWDTGATNSVISKKIVNDLGLKPSGMVTVHAVGDGDAVHTYQTPTYMVNFYLPNMVAVSGVRASLGTVTGGDILLGMDIISTGDFAISSYQGQTTWTFRFPSCEQTDYVKEINEHNKQFPSAEERRKARNKAKAEKRKTR